MARDWELGRIKDNEGAEDCYGRWIDLEDISKAGPERSILAQINQAREMWLLRPVLDLALAEDEKERPDFQICLLQHDGFSVNFRRREEACLKQMLTEVRQHCRESGYPTELEVERG